MQRVKRTLMRHAHAGSNTEVLSTDSDRLASVSDDGWSQIGRARDRIDMPANKTALVSTALRTPQTAFGLGFEVVHFDDRLDESGEIRDMDIRERTRAILDGWLPDDVLGRAHDLYDNPPDPEITYIVAHALSSAALARMAGVYLERPLRNCQYTHILL